MNPSFTAPEVNSNTTFALNLIVNDGFQNSAADTVYIEVLDLYHTQNNSEPTVTRLWQNYPNPLQNSTQIGFSLSEAGFVSLEVYNIKGEKVVTLVRETLARNSYEISWNALSSQNQPLPNGIYLYKLSTPEKIISKKMIIMQ